MKTHLTRRTLSLLLFAGSLVCIPLSAQTYSRGPRPASAELWARTELYFGTNKPDGTVVTPAEFRQFVDDQVTPRFPDGLTLLTGYGQFLNSSGTVVKERSQVLILFYPGQTLETNLKVQAIREAYKNKFQQESVLRVDSAGLVSF